MTEQFEDQWSRSLTVHGLRADEVRSVLQKSIRRGLVESAVKAAQELYESGPEAEEMLWRRLEIIAIEDVGLGMPEAPQLIEALNSQRLRRPRDIDRLMFSIHAARLLAEAPKDRTTMELALWVGAEVEAGRTVEVFDFHVDQHTRRGVELGRDTRFWWQAGGYGLENEIAPDGSPWTDDARRVLGAPVGEAPPAPDFTRPAPADPVAAALLDGE